MQDFWGHFGVILKSCDKSCSKILHKKAKNALRDWALGCIFVRADTDIVYFLIPIGLVMRYSIVIIFHDFFSVRGVIFTCLCSSRKNHKTDIIKIRAAHHEIVVVSYHF